MASDINKIKAVQGGKSKTPPASQTPIKLNDGTMLTPDMFNQSAKNGLPFTDLPAMANYYNEWVRKAPPAQTPTPPYYRHYGNGQNINSGDVEVLKAKYADNPQVMAIINRNVAKPGEVPMYGPEDGDVIKQMAAQVNKNKQLLTSN